MAISANLMRRCSAALLALLVSWPGLACASALGTERFVRFDTQGEVVLANAGFAAALVVGKDEFPGVVRAVRDLQRDIASVTGKTPAWQVGAPAAAPAAIIIGTLGRNAERHC